MADLPDSVAQQLITDIAGNISLTNNLARNSTQEVNSLMARSSARRMDELDVLEGKTAVGVYATPSAGPVNAQKAG